MENDGWKYKLNFLKHGNPSNTISAHSSQYTEINNPILVAKKTKNK